MEIFIAIVVVGLMVVGAIYAFQMAAKRRAELTQWAGQHGLSFSPAEDAGFDDRYPMFACLRRGDRRYAFNIMRGRWGQRDMIGFDYHYQTYSTDNKGRRRTHHHYFSAVLVGSAIPLEPLFIRPEGFFDKVTEFFGADDIDFESAEFSRRFFVKAPNRKWAFDVLHARTMEFMLSQPKYQLQFDRQWVLVWSGRTFAIGDYQSALDVVTGILDRLPEYVIRQQKESA